MSPESPKTVAIGLGTKIGLVLTSLAGIATAVVAAGANLHLPAKDLAILTTVSGTLTMLGRMFQATKL